MYLAPLVGALGVVAAHPAPVWMAAAAVSFAGPAAAGRGWSPSLAVGALVWVAVAAAFAVFLRLRRAQAGEVRSRVLAEERLRVTRRADALEIEVVDNGLHAPQSPSPGNGLTGMRERAVALGGAFAAGTRPQGGFRVWARLPAPPS